MTQLPESDGVAPTTAGGGIPRRLDPLIKSCDESQVDTSVKLDVRVCHLHPLASKLAAESSLCVSVP